MDPVLLVDAASLWFRAFHGVPRSVTAPDGRPIGAVRGFLDSVSALLASRAPRGLVACLDADWRPAFRVAALASYKAGRLAPDGHSEAAPPELGPQVRVLLEVLEAVGISRCELPGYEADDVIGALSHALPAPIEVVTGDRDLFQLAREGVTVLYAVEKMRCYDAAAVADRYAIPVGRYADFAILRGDPSDGLPGVPGIGDKTAAALLVQHGGLQDVVRAARTSGTVMPAPVRARVLAALPYLAAAEPVVRLSVTLPGLGIPDPALPGRPRHPRRLAALGREHGLERPLDRLCAALEVLASPGH